MLRASYMRHGNLGQGQDSKATKPKLNELLLGVFGDYDAETNGS
jgi:hypothetical protein